MARRPFLNVNMISWRKVSAWLFLTRKLNFPFRINSLNIYGNLEAIPIKWSETFIEILFGYYARGFRLWWGFHVMLQVFLRKRFIKTMKVDYML